MEHYLDHFDTFKNTVIYDFKLQSGGIGDYIKYFMYLLMVCIRNNIKLFCLKNSLTIEKYLLLKYKKLYITQQQLKNIKPGYEIKIPRDLYKCFSYGVITIPISDVFIFSDAVKLNRCFLLPLHIKKYHSLHLRMGDKYLETIKEYIDVKNDTRPYDTSKLYTFISNNKDQNLIFFSDNQNFKLKLKQKFSNIIILNSNIGHTSLRNTSDKQVLDAITELYIMTDSESITHFSPSGYSIIASKFKRIPLIDSAENKDINNILLPLVNPRIVYIILLIVIILVVTLYKWYLH